VYIMYMALHINNPETERNVRAMAAATGESIAEAVNKASLDRLRQTMRRDHDPNRMAAARALLARFDALPELDPRSADEILGYDEDGLPL